MPNSPKEDSDFSAIAKKAKAGDEGAFGEIFDRFYPEIYGFVTNQNEPDLDAPDLTQMVFVKAAQKIHQLRKTEKLRAWLYQITRNCLHDARRKKANENRLQLALVEEAQPATHKNDQADSLGDWMSQLDDPSREAVTLVYFQGLNHREAGEVMGCAEGTISWRVSEAVKQLRQIAENERKSAI